MNIVLHIFSESGNFSVENDILIILQRGTRIKTGISFRSLIGILCGPVDLSSRFLIILSTSSLDMWVTRKLN